MATYEDHGSLPYTPNAVVQTPDVGELDSYARASSNLSASQSKDSLQSMQLLHSRQSSAAIKADGSRNSNLSKTPSSAVRNRLSKYAMTPSVGENSSDDTARKPKGSSANGRQVQEELKLPSDKTDFIISLKKELKKHHTIPVTFNKLGLFEEFYKLLSDDVWEIRNECTLLIHDLLPYLKNDLDSCLTIVLPHIIPNLGSSRAAILQNSSVQLLKTFALITKDKQSLVDDLISCGVQSKSNSVSKGTIENLPNILNDNFSDEDLSYLSECLFRKLHDADLSPSILVSLKQLQYLVGQEEFERYVNRLTPRSRHSVDCLFEKAGLSSVTNGAVAPEEEGVDADDENEDDDTEISQDDIGEEEAEKEQNLNDEKEDGVSIENQVEGEEEKDEHDSDVDCDKSEKCTDDDKEKANDADVEDDDDKEEANDADVEDDDDKEEANDADVEDDDDQDVIVKEQEEPKEPDKNEKVIQRQDSQAWIEFGVVDGAIMEMIRNEDEEDADGVMAAVQARLARRKLPRVSPDGLIEYSITIPPNPKRTQLSLPKGADIDWVLAGEGSSSESRGILSALPGRVGTASLSSSFTGSDSQVHTLTSSYPQSTASARTRMVLGEGLHRKRSISDVSLNRSSSRADERGLALWTTDTIDLSRTAPSDLGAYRGVYLGKFRQGSSYARSIAVDKGFAILPNKYANGAIGSARGERVGTPGAGSRSPLLVSPTPQRRINALAPLGGSDAVITVSRAASTRSVIPPLSAVSGRRQPKDDVSSDPEELGEDDTFEEERRSDYSYEYDDEEEELVEEDEEEEEEVVEEAINEDDTASHSLKSSATTRDSGISVFSASHDGDINTENGRESSRRSSSRLPRSVRSKGSTDSLSSEEPGRSSYDLSGRKAELASPSTHSLPNEILRPNGFGVVGKGLSGTRSQPSKSRVSSRQSPGYEKDFRNFDYESDFETDDEDHNITISNTTLSKIKLLKKQKENMKEVERRRNERDMKLIQEERARKYRQLELQHSETSLQPSKPSSGDSNLVVGPKVSYKGRTPQASPRHSSNPSREDKAPRQPFSRAIPKSKSHTSNLSKSLGPPNRERRHRSLERRVNPQNARETFRTPQLVRRGQPPAGNTGSTSLNNSLGSSTGSTSFTRRNFRRPTERKTIKVEVPEKRAAIQPTHNVGPQSAPERIGPVKQQQRPQLKHHLAPRMSAESRSSDNFSMSVTSLGMRSAKPASSCFKNHLEPFPDPQEALKNALQSIHSGDWEKEMDGVKDIVRLNEHHPEILQNDLHNVNLGLLKQAKNLRSQVSRSSIQAFTRLFDNLQRSMEPDVDKITSLLLNRSADTNKFLQLDSNHALDSIVENTSPNKAIPVIIQEGLGHKNPAVRTTTARLLAYQVERLGASRILSGQKDITDRLLPAATKLAQEGSLETRKYAKQLFHMLIRHASFDAALKKHVPASEIQNIRKFLDNLTGEERTVHESARSKYSVGGSRFARTM
ncbi:TOG array regulator of axonemal microtubules protein 1 isoform X3 [Palaemon carinicauda]|uniref:TOG array regulator of axonemal microtubules protein 1 isoform X3 n=1 Tax=Palaemon carinicauda TaxID=392227 RepID=UPI0035B587F7